MKMIVVSIKYTRGSYILIARTAGLFQQQRLRRIYQTELVDGTHRYRAMGPEPIPVYRQSARR